VAQVIEACARCGFAIPTDADACPGCGPDVRRVAPRAARQAAGLALPTRSVRALPHTRARRQRSTAAPPPADDARSAFGYAVLFVLLTVAAAALAWAVQLDRFEVALPDGTAE
jgi:hypothetical protein